MLNMHGGSAWGGNGLSVVCPRAGQLSCVSCNSLAKGDSFEFCVPQDAIHVAPSCQLYGAFWTKILGRRQEYICDAPAKTQD